MTDAERDHLLQRLAEAERARRRWKWLALAGTPLLAALLAMMTAFGTSSYLLLRDALRREQKRGDSIWVDVVTQDVLVHNNVDWLGEPRQPDRMPHEPEP